MNVCCEYVCYKPIFGLKKEKYFLTNEFAYEFSRERKRLYKNSRFDVVFKVKTNLFGRTNSVVQNVGQKS